MMMKAVVLVGTVLVALLVVSCVGVQDPNNPIHAIGAHLEKQLVSQGYELTPKLRQQVCDGLHNSILNVFSCHNEDEDPSNPEWRQIYEASFGELPTGADVAHPPVVLLPGLAGSGLQAHLHRHDVPAWYCFKNSNWFNIWVSIYEGLAQKCWFDNLALRYHPANQTYSNADGVDIRSRDFGGLTGVAYLDVTDDFLHLTGYYHDMIKALQSIGYKAGVDLFGAPYDWRLPTDYLTDTTGYSAALKALIEQAYTASGGQQVNVVTHSMGGPTALYFLNAMEPAWKSKYIAKFIPIALPASGAAKALRAMVSGDDFGLEIFGLSLINRESLMYIARESGGVGELIPDSEYWEKDKVFVYTPTQKFTVSNFTTLFNQLGAPVSAAMLTDTDPVLHNLKEPKVETYCLYGTGVATEISYGYSHINHEWNPPSEFDNSDLGDGTVPLNSLRLCKSWAEKNTNIHCKEFHLRTHTGILKDAAVIAEVIAIVNDEGGFTGCEDTPVYNDAVARGVIPHH